MKASALLRPASMFVALVLALGACAKDTDAPSDSTGTVVAASPDSTGSIPTTTDANVTAAANPAITQLKLTSGGGYTTWQYNVGTLPIAWISGDTLLRGIPNETMNPTVSKATQQSIKLRAREKLAELLVGMGFAAEPLDFGQPGVSDMPTTTLEFVLDGKTYRQDAYALGFGQDDADSDSVADLGFNDEQEKNRANFQELVEMLRDPVNSYGKENISEPTDFKPTSYVLWGQLLTGTDPDAGDQVKWPHDSIPLTAFSDNIVCREVADAEVSAVAATFAALTPPAEAQAKVAAPSGNTVFVQGKDRALLVLVPVFPGLDGCPKTA
jgi:hypothetical protein